jgi:hypothetical protein
MKLALSLPPPCGKLQRGWPRLHLSFEAWGSPTVRSAALYLTYLYLEATETVPTELFQEIHNALFPQLFQRSL